MWTDSSECAPSGELLLLREHSHRINNELASAISVLSLAAARCSSDEARTVLASVEKRLRNYARVHNSLRMPEHSTLIDATSYLRQLCQAISEAKLQNEGIELLLIDKPLKMSSERCWLLGMIISELVANSVRHSLHDGPGRISIEIRISKTAVECCVSDNGNCISSAHPGQGLSIIGALASRLHGTIQQRFEPYGSQSVLVFPTNFATPSAGTLCECSPTSPHR
jgi:two-component sensor histidine kinase